jgi:hypothetical protein
MLQPLALSVDLDFFSTTEEIRGGGQPQSRQSAMLFLQSSELVLPQPLTPRRVCPPPRFWGEGHTRRRERGRAPTFMRIRILPFKLMGTIRTAGCRM